MTHTKALKLALEALEADELDMVDDGSGNMVFRKEQSITAIKEALAQPAQEPVAWNKPELKTLKHSDNCRYWDEDIYCTCGAIEYAELQFWKNKALAQPAQEPDALTIAYQSGFYDGKKAAQRPWLEMTDEDYARISALCLTPKQAATCAAHILKEKNS